jgi:predicted metallopeptidase
VSNGHATQLPADDDLLDAILQPKTGRKSEYADSPEVQEKAEAIIDTYGLIDASLARIKYLYKIAEKSKFRGKCALSGAQWKHLTGYDFVIVIWKQWWDQATDKEREALLYHELLHVERTETKKGTKWVLRDHPVEAFPEEVQQFGAWSPELVQLAETLKMGVKQSSDDSSESLENVQSAGGFGG